ncbi:MAG TPA: hypothetical protein VMX16_03575 [Terriglobia bacterium]|nr:hypothetical protein [Terriglobia bacterium]
MRAFIFGAGASHHVGYPLIKDLGRVLIQWAAKNPQPHLHWIDPDELNAIFDQSSLDDFELVITELEDPTPGSPVSLLPPAKCKSILEGFRNAICEFFDSMRADEAVLYRQFANERVKSGDVVISFNYDVSLERELRRAGRWEISDGYGFNLGIGSLPASPVKLLKLHGSTNWIDLLFEGRTGFSFGMHTDPLGPRPVILPQEFGFLEYDSKIRDIRFSGGGVDRGGSMILPARNKQFGAREDFWNGLWRQAEHALRRAEHIAVIGYSFPAADERARKLIFGRGNRRATLTVCCGGDSARVSREFRESGFAQVQKGSEYFESWVDGSKC